MSLTPRPPAPPVQAGSPSLGLVLSDEKAYLLDSRLRPVARRFGLAGAADVAARLRRGADEPLAAAVTEA